MTRPSWDETWMGVAEIVALRSKCIRAQVGAVVVDPTNRPVATGYNGEPAGLAQSLLESSPGQTCQLWCPRSQTGAERGLTYDNCYMVHAEANALMFSDRRTYEGGTLYVSRACCWGCGKMVANSGVARVVMNLTDDDAHRDPLRTVEFMRDCGLEVEVFHGESLADR